MSSIPMFVTHKAPVKAETKPELQAPSEETLKMLVDGKNFDVVNTFIQGFNLPYEIRDGKLIDKAKGTELWLRKFVTVHEETLSLKSYINTLAKHNDEVLIIGETGTGKELLSRALIGNREGKIVAINCAGLPEHLIESELFGYKRGAFTGAEGDRQGLLAMAKDGMLFMDEIGELPLQGQSKLLRALQDRVIRRVGSTVEEEINCRIVFATNKNLRKMVERGLFRQDLYARISTFEFEVKPLRERKCDLELICKSITGGDAFYTKHGEMLHDGRLPLEHNVRSIQQHIRRYTVFDKVML